MKVKTIFASITLAACLIATAQPATAAIIQPKTHNYARQVAKIIDTDKKYTYAKYTTHPGYVRIKTANIKPYKDGNIKTGEFISVFRKPQGFTGIELTRRPIK